MKKILCIDGGGIRGLIPALVLTELEKRSGRPISKSFDLIAGTSTGGILTLGLAKPYPARELVDLYEKNGARIFERSWLSAVGDLGGLLNERYPSRGIEAVLRERFGDTRLKEAATGVLITAYEIEHRSPWFFRSYRAKADPDYDFPMRDVARCTSAAPTYFEPKGLRGGVALVDGGVFANNPAMCAYAEIIAAEPQAAARCVVVSLGTGAATHAIHARQARRWGLLGWARPILDVVFHGVSATVDYQLAQLLGPDRHFRLDLQLSDASESMDDASPENLRRLRKAAERLIERESLKIDRICALIASG